MMKVWTIPVIWLFLLTVGSLLPGKTLPVHSWELTDNFDKFLHFLAYLGLTVCIVWVNKRNKILNVWQLILVIIVIALYSGFIEIMQAWLYQDRFFEVFDIFANIIGLITGYGISVRFLKSKKDGI